MSLGSLGVREVAELKEAIVCRVQHELRTPVTIAAMAFEVLRSGPADPDTEERCKEMLGRALTRLQQHVRKLDLLSPAGSAINAAETDLVDLLHRALRELEPLFRERGVETALSIAGDWRTLRLDESLVLVAIKNVLENAARFNRPGGHVMVSVSFHDWGARIRIEDDGIGIPADHLERVMSGFHQVADFLTRAEGGLGIGLAGARRIVEGHGGRIAASSRVGKGSVFTLILPEAHREP